MPRPLRILGLALCGLSCRERASNEATQGLVVCSSNSIQTALKGVEVDALLTAIGSPLAALDPKRSFVVYEETIVSGVPGIVRGCPPAGAIFHGLPARLIHLYWNDTPLRELINATWRGLR